jgi:hypothetical protein
MPVSAQTQAAAPTFQAQFQQVMYYIGPVMQVVFWIGMLVLAVLAYLQFKRVVDAGLMAMGARLAGAEEAKGAAGPRGKGAAGEVSVDEFVE